MYSVESVVQPSLEGYLWLNSNKNTPTLNVLTVFSSFYNLFEPVAALAMCLQPSDFVLDEDFEIRCFVNYSLSVMIWLIVGECLLVRVTDR